jgi:hypothetical protein
MLKESNMDCDVAESPLASHDEVRCELYRDFHEDESPEEMQERMEREACHDMAKKFLSMIRFTLLWCKEGKTAAQCLERLEIASWMFGNDATSDWSIAKLARHFGKTRASFNNSLLNFQAGLDLPPSVAQKIIESRRAFSIARKQNLIQK